MPRESEHRGGWLVAVRARGVAVAVAMGLGFGASLLSYQGADAPRSLGG